MDKSSSIDVGFVTSVLQRMKGSAAQTNRCYHQHGCENGLNMPVESLLLNGLYVMEKLSTPSTDPDIVTRVIAQFICAILETSCLSNPSGGSDVVTEFSTLVSSLQSRQCGAFSKTLHDYTPGTGSHEECPSREPQTEATAYTALEGCGGGGAGCAFTDELHQVVTEPEIKTEGYYPPRTRHNYKITKNIPPEIVCCLRGVRCQLCYHAFKGVKCVADLIEHTKLKHKAQASPKFLRQLRESNTPGKMVGNGMLYCTCETCSYVGPGSVRNLIGIK